MIACFPINIAASAIQMQAIAGQQYDHDDSVDAKKDKKGKSKDKKSKSNEKVPLLVSMLGFDIYSYMAVLLRMRPRNLRRSQWVVQVMER